MAPYNVLVIGDACIDEYRFGSVTRLNPEAPVPILNIERSEKKLGMAHNVAANLKTFGVNVSLRTPESLSTKIRYIDSRTGYQMLRVDDDVHPEPYKPETHYQYDAVIISDYNKGFIGLEQLHEIQAAFSGPVFIDTKKQNLPDYENFIYKINDLEFRQLQTQPKHLIVTKGSQGCSYNGQDFPAFPIDVVDVCGAGDVFLAGLVYGYLEFKSVFAAIRVANKCAAISCHHLGGYVLTPEDVQCVF
jgi:D-beta-D-heptose 7-phosphate kinase/D-beta-D-heptose 1-phosphate adenosyltransferase